MSESVKKSVTCKQIIDQVVTRLRIAAVGERFYLFTLLSAALYAGILLLARLTGTLESIRFSPWTLGIIPLSGLVLAALFHPKPSRADAARAVDRNKGTKDLFLTYAMLDGSAGDYQPLVEADAQRHAARVDPERVVTWEWQSKFSQVGVAFAALWLAVAFFPQFDPFGKVAKAEETKQQQLQLQKDKTATELRKAELEKQGEASKDSEAVDKAINDLTKTFSEMRKDTPEANRKKLNERQKDIGEKWRKIGADQLKTLLSQNGDFQDFGGDRQEKLRKWTDELLNGESEELRSELEAIKQQLKDLLTEKDPLRRAEMAKDLKEQLRDLEEFASENAGSPELTAALRRAIRQMEAAENAQDKEAVKDAMEALAESMDLTKMELQQLAQAAKDMKRLEEALETMAKAKQLNEEGKLDGEATSEFQSLSDYAELYEEMMGEGQGDGEGTGGEGIGEGGEVPEDDSVDSNFKKEQEKPATKAGKILMSLKGKGMSEKGEAKQDYSQAINDVKQGVSEAISQEQIPPGYHDGIRDYFNSIGDEE